MGKAYDRFRKQQSKYSALLNAKTAELVASGVDPVVAKEQATELATAWSKSCTTGRKQGTNRGRKVTTPI